MTFYLIGIFKKYSCANNISMDLFLSNFDKLPCVKTFLNPPFPVEMRLGRGENIFSQKCMPKSADMTLALHH